MTNVIKKAYTEVNAALAYLPQEYINKIPKKMRDMFNEYKLDDYVVKIDPDKGVDEQGFTYETLVIFTILRLNYWWETEEEKKKLMDQIAENDKKLSDRYDISKLNKSNNILQEDLNTTNLVTNQNLPVKVEKENWFTKLIKKIFKK